MPPIRSGSASGRLGDFRDHKLTQHFDVLQVLPPIVKPRMAMPLRYYAMTEAQRLCRTNCRPFLAQDAQVMDCFEMIRDFRGLPAGFSPCHDHNTNSPARSSPDAGHHRPPTGSC